eukprot:scaffold1318_cov388-Prasinococcus_capsulatus_cf.AAC.71
MPWAASAAYNCACSQPILQHFHKDAAKRTGEMMQSSSVHMMLRRGMGGPSPLCLRSARVLRSEALPNSASGRRSCSFGVSCKFAGFDELLREQQGKSKGGFGGSKRVRTKNGRVLLEPGIVSPPLEVPQSIPRPSYAGSGRAPPFSDSYQYALDDDKRERMRAAGALAARVRDYAGASLGPLLVTVGTLVKPGVTTDEIDKAVHQMIIDAGAYPSPLNYGSFPKSVCTSVNECICHGIPDNRELVDGDIINIDVTVFLNGVHGDTSRTFYCGNVSEDAKQLVSATREALEAAVAIVQPDARLCDIGNAIQKVADKYGY